MSKRPYLHFGIGMGVYSLLLILSVMSMQQYELGALTYGVALLPVLPFCYSMFAVVLAIRQQDELIRRMHMESVLITALITGGWTFSWGLLESASLLPHLPAVWIAPSMIAVWGIVNTFVARQYE